MTNDREQMRGRWSLVIGCLLVIGIWNLGISVPHAAGQSTWLMTTADFQTQQVILHSIDHSALTIESATAPTTQTTDIQPATTSVPLDRLLLLARPENKAAAGGKFLVSFGSGDVAAGQPVGLQGENLLWETPALGRLSLPLKSITGITRISDSKSANPQSAVPNPQLEDIVTLLNGDSVHGIIDTINASTITVQQSGGDKTPVPLDSIARVTFATVGNPGAATKPSTEAHGFRVTLSDGSALSAAEIATTSDQSLKLSLDGQERSVPLDSVVSIEQLNGPVTWLSSITPIESVQTSLLDMSWPPRMDRAVDGSPIRFDDRTFAHGIGVHSYSRLTFPIDPKFKAFRTQYAIAGELPYADVTVRIKLDGQTVHEQPNFHCDVLAKPVILDITGHKQITLEVDYGANEDVQDRFNWIEPAMLTFKP